MKSVSLWPPHLQHRQEPQHNNFQQMKLPRLRGLTVMKRVQRQQHLITIISLLWLARSTPLAPLLKWQPPLKQLPRGVPSCPDRGIMSSVCPPELACHIHRSGLLSRCSVTPAQRQHSFGSLMPLMTLWPPPDWGRTLNCTWCKVAYWEGWVGGGWRDRSRIHTWAVENVRESRSGCFLYFAYDAWRTRQETVWVGHVQVTCPEHPGKGWCPGKE